MRLVFLAIIIIIIIFLSLMPLVHSTTVHPYVDQPFLQPFSTKYLYSNIQIGNLQHLPFASPVTHIVPMNPTSDSNVFIALSGASLYEINFSNASSPLVRQLDSLWNVSLQDPSWLQLFDDFLFILGSEKSFLCFISSGSCKSMAGLGARVTSSCTSSSGAVFLGTDGRGVYSIESPSFVIKQMTQIESNATVTSVAWDERRSFLWVAVVRPHRRVAYFDPDDANVREWQFIYAMVMAEHIPTSLLFDDDGLLWIAFNGSLSTLHADWTIRWLSGRDGVPILNISRLYLAPSGAVWASTSYGAWRYANGAYKYFYGPRWIVDTSAATTEEISTMAFTPAFDSIAEFAVIATRLGLSTISFMNLTLESKAALFEEMSLSYYQPIRQWNTTDDSTYPPPAMFLAQYLTQYANTSSVIKTGYLIDGEDAGIWTGMHLVSQALRYTVTNETEARSNAWSLFLALEAFHNITGVKGLVARSAYYGAAPPSSNWGLNPWYNSSVAPGWVWQGGVSSDQLDGHMLAYAVMYDLVAQTDEERSRILNALTSIVDYLMENDYAYIDANGNHTHWGVFGPRYLNGDPFYWDERGLNSMSIISWLLLAFKYTKNDTYQRAVQTLIEDHGYARNIINARNDDPSQLNGSDDNLLFLVYLTYGWSLFNNPTNFSHLATSFDLSLDRSWSGVQSERLSLWNFVYAFVQQHRNNASHPLAPAVVSDAAWQLRTFTIDLLSWPVNNTLRLDVGIDPLVPGCLAHAVDYDELAQETTWNASPLIIAGGNGSELMLPTMYLLPYWLARYADYIVS